MYGEKKKVWTSISSKNYVWVVAVFFLAVPDQFVNIRHKKRLEKSPLRWAFEQVALQT